jgi:hypothetical protein
MKCSKCNHELADLPVFPKRRTMAADWLVLPVAAKAAGYRSADGKDLILDNGLIRRTFRMSPNAACVAFDNLRTGESILRAVKPEATLTVNGTDYQVGGLIGQPNRAYLRREWIDALTAAPNAFRCDGFVVSKTAARFPWKPTGGVQAPWPPPGVSMALRFAPPPHHGNGEMPRLEVIVHYELYDGQPLIAKWLTVTNCGKKPVRLNAFTVELLAVVEYQSIVEKSKRWELPNITVVTDYSFGGMTMNSAQSSVRWAPDPEYDTQVNWANQTPCLLTVRPPIGPMIELAPGESVQSFRVFELVHDSDNRERKGLAIRRMCRTIAPWCLDSPLMLHVTSTDPTVIRTAIDQCAEVGYEMVIISFGSGLNMEDISPANIAKFKALADHAKAMGIRLGGYSQLAGRRISDEHDVINPNTGKPGGAIFGSSPCLCSAWGREYFEKIERFLTETGFDLLEHDGSYPGDVCASTTHPDHCELGDSQWHQFQRIAAFYRHCREQGIFLNVPDWYFLQGSCKTGMGYRETNWSLPRVEQHIHCRQNLYDGTWEKTPTMGGMFVPLVEYLGGGAAATIEPLRKHLPDYERHLANNLGYGAQACYRGFRLFDARATRAMVKKLVSWFKTHRAILESDIIHLRRADGRDWDGVMHVNPALPTKGMAVLYNPLNEPIARTIALPLYYTGLTKTARLRINGKGGTKTAALDGDHTVRIKVNIPAQAMVWVTVE